MFIANWLSRAYLPLTPTRKIFDEVENINALDFANVSKPTQALIQGATATDSQCQHLAMVIKNGWPNSRDEVPIPIREFFNFLEEMTVQNGVIFKGQRILRQKKCDRC